MPVRYAEEDKLSEFTKCSIGVKLKNGKKLTFYNMLLEVDIINYRPMYIGISQTSTKCFEDEKFTIASVYSTIGIAGERQYIESYLYYSLKKENKFIDRTVKLVAFQDVTRVVLVKNRMEMDVDESLDIDLMLG